MEDEEQSWEEVKAQVEEAVDQFLKDKVRQLTDMVRLLEEYTQDHKN